MVCLKLISLIVQCPHLASFLHPSSSFLTGPTAHDDRSARQQHTAEAGELHLRIDYLRLGSSFSFSRRPVVIERYRVCGLAHLVPSDPARYPPGFMGIVPLRPRFLDRSHAKERYRASHRASQNLSPPRSSSAMSNVPQAAVRPHSANHSRFCPCRACTARTGPAPGDG